MEMETVGEGGMRDTERQRERKQWEGACVRTAIKRL